MIPDKVLDSLARHIAAYGRLKRTMQGISTCATKCGCCEMHKRISENALLEAEKCLKPPSRS